MSGKVFPLKDNQAAAVDPGFSVWLSASAGTGKTQVLSARVLRLLLEPGVRPEQLLCLTFTKAGAAEMATRVNEVLANWVRMEDTRLAADLVAIGAAGDAATIARARTLFASVLDCAGGGLRIDTIHAFSQWLLSAFPHEAGLTPGTRAMEDRERDLLAKQTLRELLREWRDAAVPSLAALQDLSLRLGPDGALAWMMRCAAMREAWFGPAAWQPPLMPRVKRLLGLTADADAATLAAQCLPPAFDESPLRCVLAAYQGWNTASALKVVAHIQSWLDADAEGRLSGIAGLRGAVFNKEGALKWASSVEKVDPEVGRSAEIVLRQLEGIGDQAILLELSAILAPALEVGRLFALRWDEVKAREGLVDFDDLIAKAAALLAGQDMSAWIRYKLDREFDHILVDEAQDTNSAQWAIVDALTDDFFTGYGQAGSRLRTVFVVGDYKQAIFRFQGTSPEEFAAARRRYARRLGEWKANAPALRDGYKPEDLRDLGLGRSYRTAHNVLEFVDEAIAAIGPASFGLDRAPDPHRGQDRQGMVTLWQPVPGHPDDVEVEEADGPELGVSPPERRMAEKIAQQIKQMWDGGFTLVKGDAPRRATPGDFMVLVRKRKELANLIVARLHAAGVPVAGVDRLRLGAPLAVKDVMAALRFAVQPADDLSLACLLVSPIFGWSQDDLMRCALRPKDRSLWDHMRDLGDRQAGEAVIRLNDLLDRVDFEQPQALLHWILTGPWQARARIVARLGREANDPLDELLNAAQHYAGAYTASLQGFIHWFDAGDGELKREAEGAGDVVRVMTVHGSKGLQAPIVILADATGNPDASRPAPVELVEEQPGGQEGGPTPAVPLLPLRKEERVGRIAAASDAARAAEREEHWRLLYVAMTRAEEALFIGGALGKKEREPAPDSWFARLAPLFDADPLDDPNWGWRLERGQPAPIARPRTGDAPERSIDLPQWATTPVGAEPRPPRPLAPSASADDVSANPPLPAAEAAIAARRGVLIHALLERLPDAEPDLRAAAGRAWLARHSPELDEGDRQEMLDRALAVMDRDEWRDLFGPAALAEVPIAATVGPQVITGTVDRLLVLPDRIMVADFKTARRPPSSAEQVPAGTLRQMAAYVAALQIIYPGRRIEAAVLYTQTPVLFALQEETLAPYKPN